MQITETQAQIPHVIEGLCGEHFHASVTEVETCEFRAVDELRARSTRACWIGGLGEAEQAWALHTRVSEGVYSRWIDQPEYDGHANPLAIQDPEVDASEWTLTDVADWEEWMEGERREAMAEAAWARSCPWG